MMCRRHAVIPHAADRDRRDREHGRGPVEGGDPREGILKLALVKSWGCREVQGHYFAKPLPVAELSALLRVGKIVPASPERAA
jgi:hypothetical protein